MPKKVIYPLDTLTHAMRIAKAVYALGGGCQVDECAQHLGKALSGGFHSSISSAVKYGLIHNKRQTLSTTDLFKSIELAYDDEERRQFMTEAFLNIPLFKTLMNMSPEIQLSREDRVIKQLVREYDVEPKHAEKIYAIFTKTVKELNIPITGTTVPTITAASPSIIPKSDAAPPTPTTNTAAPPTGGFTITISGPGIQSELTISNADDLLILDSMTQKIRKTLILSDLST